ncbi:MAG: hypothetical protein QNJ41_00735 [Xenococcaceae cyanobacterium MO_188.B32]|nr:hypothetical protein [Xenococcaceae cyanobacterium MO_188.B32]
MNGHSLKTGDGAAITQEKNIAIRQSLPPTAIATTSNDTEILLFDLA